MNVAALASRMGGVSPNEALAMKFSLLPWYVGLDTEDVPRAVWNHLMATAVGADRVVVCDTCGGAFAADPAEVQAEPCPNPRCDSHLLVMSPEELEDTYLLAGEHPVFSIDKWREVTASRLCLLGYWDWVHQQLTVNLRVSWPVTA